MNETGKDGSITVARQATTAVHHGSSRASRAKNLDFRASSGARGARFTAPFQLIVENSNETWNQGSRRRDFLAAAGHGARYTGAYAGSYGLVVDVGSTDLMKVAQFGRSPRQDRQRVPAALDAVGHASVVAPVLSGWALGAVYSDEGL